MVVDLSLLYPTLKSKRWDKQTVVIVCDSWDRACAVRSALSKQRSPQSRHFIVAGAIESDSFVNLDYNPHKDKRPQDRNVRVVYVDGSHVSFQEVCSRFSDAYIASVDAPSGWMDGGDNIDTDEQPKIEGTRTKIGTIGVIGKGHSIRRTINDRLSEISGGEGSTR